MNPPSDIAPASSRDAGTAPEASSESWRDAFAGLLATRLSLIKLESQDAAKQVVRSIVFVGIACLCALFGYLLLLAGAVSLVADAGGWPWNWVAVVGALLHLVVAIIFATMAKSKGDTFSATRAEFQKDREWLENLKKTRKSNS